MSQEIQCDVYKSAVKANYYLYVVADEGLDRVPETLIEQLGDMVLVLTISMTIERRLAKEDPKKVMNNLQEQGYHLQLPPADYPNADNLNFNVRP